MYAVTQPRPLDSQESVKAATISFSILFCKNALHVEDLLQNAFYNYLPLHIRIMSKYPSAQARARYFCVSPPWYMFVFHNIRTGLVSITISNQKVGEYASLLLVR